MKWRSKASRAPVRRGRTADLVLLVIDRSCPIEETDRDLLRETADVPRLVVASEVRSAARMAGCQTICPSSRCRRRPVSASTVCARRCGRRWKAANPATAPDTAAVTNVRHAALLERARAALRRAVEAVEAPGGPVAGRIRPDRSSRRARRARRSDRQAHVRRSAAAHFLAVLYREVFDVSPPRRDKNLCAFASLR